MSTSAPRFPARSRRRAGGARRAIAAAVSLALVAIVAGCSGPGSAPRSVALSESAGWPEAEAPRPAPDIADYPVRPVGWVAEDGERFWIVTWGSGSCVFIASRLEVVDDASVAVRFEQAPAEGCTDDLVPRAHEFAVPEDLVGSLRAAEVTLVENAFAHLGGGVKQSEWTVDLVEAWFATIAESFEAGLPEGLPPAPEGAESFLPRVLVRSAEGPIALVTYGSSSCPALPTNVSIENGGDGDELLAITVQPRPAEACTADMAPTTSFLPAVEGFDAAEVLTARITLVDPNTEESVTSVAIEWRD